MVVGQNKTGPLPEGKPLPNHGGDPSRVGGVPQSSELPDSTILAKSVDRHTPKYRQYRRGSACKGGDPFERPIVIGNPRFDAWRPEVPVLGRRPISSIIASNPATRWIGYRQRAQFVERLLGDRLNLESQNGNPGLSMIRRGAT